MSYKSSVRWRYKDMVNNERGAKMRLQTRDYKAESGRTEMV